MKNNIFLIGILYFLISTTGFAQQWTEPVNISNSTENYNYDPKFCIDSNGTIHCVWRYVVPWHTELSRIYYSKSLNDGESWGEPEIVNKDEENAALYEPAIAVNSKGDVAIAFTKEGDYSSSYICLAHKQANKWQEDTISQGFPGSMLPLITCDNNDIFFLLWFHSGPYGDIYYRKIDDGFNISPIFDMLVDSNLNLAIGNLFFDKQNKLHFTANHNQYLSQSQDTRTAYYVFDFDQCEMINIFGSMQTPYSMVCIDKALNPLVSWKQVCNYLLHNYDCYCSQQLNGQWGEPILIADSVHDYSMCMDNRGKIHFLITSGTENKRTSSLYYYAPGEFGWELSYLDDSESFFTHVQSAYYNQSLFIIYEDCSYDGDTINKYSNILFRKTDLISSYGDEKPPKGEINIYPNPFRGKLNINGFFRVGGTTQLEIFTYDGILVFSDQVETTEEGAFNYSWNGETSSGTKLQEGIYLLCLSSGELVVCKTIISIN